VLAIAFAGTVAAQSLPVPAEGDLIGASQTTLVLPEDTLSDIARRHDLGYDEIVHANPDIDPWLPGVGRRVELPTERILPAGERRGIVLNVPEMRLYYFTSDRGDIAEVKTHPVSIGDIGWNTPIGLTRIVAKTEKPTWIPPASIRAEHAADGDPLPAAVPPGPDNPLGDYAMRLGLPGYLIHGTNRPYGIGMRVTHGCVRLYPEDIETLFREVPVGTPVRIVDQPYKAGWRNGVLYLESHRPLEGREAQSTNLTPMVRAVTAALGDRNVEVDWRRAEQVAQEARGIPVPIYDGLLGPPVAALSTPPGK